MCPDPDINSLESEGIVSCNKTEESEVVRHRRLAFFNNKEECYDIPQQNLSLKKLIDESSAPQEESNSSNEENIRIRLKYLNDDQKLVEGNLQEPLGDFKRLVVNYVKFCYSNKTIVYNKCIDILILGATLV